MSNFDIECPRNDHRLFPKWDIHVVLEYLQSDDLCDLQNMSMKDLARKTMFLIALAAAFRVSELHALSRSPNCLRWIQDGSNTLQTFLGFIAKNKRASCAGQRVTRQPLTDNPSYAQSLTYECTCTSLWMRILSSSSNLSELRITRKLRN